MFFPCTHNEKIITSDNRRSSTSLTDPPEKSPVYKTKPTVVICSPNALYY
jgi:alpha/beta superfamily hydrolase